MVKEVDIQAILISVINIIKALVKYLVHGRIRVDF